MTARMKLVHGIFKQYAKQIATKTDMMNVITQTVAVALLIFVHSINTGNVNLPDKYNAFILTVVMWVFLCF